MIGVATSMLAPLIAASVIVCGWWLLVPRSWRASPVPGRHERTTALKGTEHGGLALGMGLSVFLMAAWLAFLSGDAHSSTGHVLRDLAIALLLIFAVLFLCFISIATLGRPRMLIPAALREAPNQTPGHPMTLTKQGHDEAHEIGIWSVETEQPYEADLAGEIHYAKFTANMFQVSRGVGGRVIVTNLRIIFTPFDLSRANGGRDWQIGLEQVLAADVAPRSWAVSDGAGRRRLRIRAHAGGAAYFVVWHPKRKAALVNRIRQGNASGQ